MIAGHNSIGVDDFVSEFDMLDGLRFQLLSERRSARESVQAIKAIISGNELDPTYTRVAYTRVAYTRDRTSEIVNESVSSIMQGTKPVDYVNSKILESTSAITIDDTPVRVQARDITCECEICQEMLQVREEWPHWRPSDPWEVYFVSVFSLPLK